MSDSTTDLNTGKLSGWETLGQSLASVAPTASPAMVVPLVLATSGRASWLAYVLATVGIVCIGTQINRFTVRTASPGSLYSFAHGSLGKAASLITGWALLIAYVGTAAAVTGGFTSYLFALSGRSGLPSPLVASLLTLVATGLAGVLAYRDVQLSARLMLWLEALSVTLILILFFYPSHHGALHFDAAQFRFTRADAGSLRGGLVLAIFSFVGFESAAALGSESSNPKRTIPGAIRLTALASGLFFVLTAYAEYSGFAASIKDLPTASAPLQLLAQLRGLPQLAPFLAIGSVISFFACTLACITAAARTAFAMSRDGYFPPAIGLAHKTNHTPHIAVVLVTVATAIPAIALSVRGVSPFDIYGWIGTIATFGFITAYFAVTAASIREAVRERSVTFVSFLTAGGAIAVLTLAAWSVFDVTDPGPVRWLPYEYFALLALGILLSTVVSRALQALNEQPPCETCRP